MAEHSPGPWIVHEDPKGFGLMPVSALSVLDQNGDLVVELFDDLGPSPNAQSNAPLIASAPRLKEERDALLKACERTEEAIVHFFRDGLRSEVPTPLVAYVRAAVAKCRESDDAD